MKSSFSSLDLPSPSLCPSPVASCVSLHYVTWCLRTAAAAADRQGWAVPDSLRIDGPPLQSGDHTESNTERERGKEWAFWWKLRWGFGPRWWRKMENKRGLELGCMSLWLALKSAIQQKPPYARSVCHEKMKRLFCRKYITLRHGLLYFPNAAEILILVLNLHCKFSGCIQH